MLTGFEVVVFLIVLTLARLVLPVTLLLTVGSYLERRFSGV